VFLILGVYWALVFSININDMMIMIVLVFKFEYFV